ncbi:hypothetical protein ACOSQ3_000763 [Xanthoceras sorbifolium]
MRKAREGFGAFELQLAAANWQILKLERVLLVIRQEKPPSLGSSDKIKHNIRHHRKQRKQKQIDPQKRFSLNTQNTKTITGTVIG